MGPTDSFVVPYLSNFELLVPLLRNSFFKAASLQIDHLISLSESNVLSLREGVALKVACLLAANCEVCFCKLQKS